MTFAILFFVAMWAGAQNALAGGGSFLTLPALMFTGMDALAANITSCVALFPAQIATGWTGRKFAVGAGGLSLRTLFLISIIGGVIGAGVLLLTPRGLFAQLVPWLVLFATAIFGWGSFIRKPGDTQGHAPAPLVGLLQFLISIYGGFFGAGQGVLMLALFLLTANIDIHEASGLRLMCGALSNTVATLVFAVQGIINWKVGIPMILASCAGGYFGAQWIKKLDANRARLCVLIFAWTISIWLLVRDHL